MKKAIPFVILGILVLAAIGWGITSALNAKVAVAEAKAKANEEKAAALADQISRLHDQIVQSEKALADFQAQSKARETWFQAQLAKVSTATPAQLVDQGSAILGVADITTDGTKVTTSVSTYRAIVSILVDWNEYKTVRAPGWAKERGLLNDQIAGLKAQAALDAQKDAAIAASIADLKSVISHQKVASTLDKILWAGAGIGAGLLAGRLLK